MITVERLKEVLSYDPDTGLFLTRESRGGRPAGVIYGYTTHQGYIRFEIDGVKISAHRAAIAYVEGKWPDPDLEVDHKNRTRNDNRYDNLFEVTRLQNAQNNSAKGYSYDKNRNKYMASICVNNKRLNLGRYDTEEEARLAYIIAKEKYHYVPRI